MHEHCICFSIPRFNLYMSTALYKLCCGAIWNFYYKNFVTRCSITYNSQGLFDRSECIAPHAIQVAKRPSLWNLFHIRFLLTTKTVLQLRSRIAVGLVSECDNRRLLDSRSQKSYGCTTLAHGPTSFLHFLPGLCLHNALSLKKILVYFYLVY